ATLGKRYAYNMGWFMAIIYTPALVAVLAWVCARYTCSLLGWDVTGGACMTIAAMYMCLDFAMNALSPKLSGKFQVSTTVIKMIPLILMAIIGTIFGLANGNLVQEFTNTPVTNIPFMEGLTGAVVSVAFACEGWILATSINAELKNAKRNLPLALMIGAVIVVSTYILYYIGISGAAGSSVLLGSGENGVRIAFSNLFGQTAGTLVFVLIVISCLGTLNGLMLANCRAMYALAARNDGPLPELFKQVDGYTKMPTNSSIIGLALAAFWLFYFYGANLGGGWFGNFCFDSSELPIITVYGMYIPMFIQFMRISKDLKPFTRYVMPILAILGSLVMVYAAFTAYGVNTVIHYLIIYVVVMIIGNLFYRK
ncbi:MAG: APC family permease, partial [Erysipelotrichaceae bacterium]|nr:APC family permease [Erysipelotrichaceae bacterium]